MGLTAEEFATLVQSLGVRVSETATEKRRAPRIGHHESVQITVCANAPAPDDPAEAPARVVARLTNISSRGVALTHARPILPGQQFIIHLDSTSAKEIHILCTVVHCRTKVGGGYRIGAEFTCSVPADTAARAEMDQSQSMRIRQSILG